MINKSLLQQYIVHHQILKDHIGMVLVNYLQGEYKYAEMDLRIDMHFILTRIQGMKEMEQALVKELNGKGE